MMKHYGYTAKETMAWCRICRPGSIVGPQQQFLISVESKLIHEGNLYRERLRATNAAVLSSHQSTNNNTNSHQKSIYSSSNGTTVSTLASDSGEHSRSTTPLIHQNNNQNNQPRQAGKTFVKLIRLSSSPFLISFLLYREHL